MAGISDTGAAMQPTRINHAWAAIKSRLLNLDLRAAEVGFQNLCAAGATDAEKQAVAREADDLRYNLGVWRGQARRIRQSLVEEGEWFE